MRTVAWLAAAALLACSGAVSLGDDPSVLAPDRSFVFPENGGSAARGPEGDYSVTLARNSERYSGVCLEFGGDQSWEPDGVLIVEAKLLEPESLIRVELKVEPEDIESGTAAFDRELEPGDVQSLEVEVDDVADDIRRAVRRVCLVVDWDELDAAQVRIDVLRLELHRSLYD
jgi:hypothetical protein